MAISRHFVDAVIQNFKWQPYIEGHWIDFGKEKGGAIITFKNHTDHKFRCSNKIASEILVMATEYCEGEK
jgi:Fe-S cluster assembly iron-binding protein IscA